MKYIKSKIFKSDFALLYFRKLVEQFLSDILIFCFFTTKMVLFGAIKEKLKP